MIDLKTIPSSPGIYIYRNKAGEIIYVGKAINLKKRVSQYFQLHDALGPKTKTLVSQIDSIETKIVGSEIEALILESSYIKKYHPKYNSMLKDDRSYQYIYITRDKLPRIYPVFESSKLREGYLYGPFPNGTAVKQLLKTIRHIFPYYGNKKHPSTKCLYCHLNICPGPAPDRVVYRHHISKIKQILSGKFTLLQRQLKKEMLVASSLQNFEQALLIKNQLDSINYVISGWHNLNHLFSSVNLPEDSHSQAISELSTILRPYFNLDNLHRLECFDISQMGTKYFVGSMSVWQNGHLDYSQYRQFKIKNVLTHTSLRGVLSMSKDDEAISLESNKTIDTITANDAYMIKEIVYRRLQHPEWGTPDLIIVDGGKPQVTSALSLYTMDNIPIPPVLGLAKKFEIIVIKTSDSWQEIRLPSNSKALLLLESLRNEAHRFANRYRRKLMSKSIDVK
jgi:excinuclease ABC subunit C